MLKWVSVNTRPRQLGFDAAVAKPAQPAADADDTTANGLQLECQTGPLNTARKFPLVIDGLKTDYPVTEVTLSFRLCLAN